MMTRANLTIRFLWAITMLLTSSVVVASAEPPSLEAEEQRVESRFVPLFSVVTEAVIYPPSRLSAGPLCLQSFY